MLFQLQLFFKRLWAKRLYFKFRNQLNEVSKSNDPANPENIVKSLFSNMSVADRQITLILIKLRQAIRDIIEVSNRPEHRYLTPYFFEQYILSETMAKRDWEFIEDIVLHTTEETVLDSAFDLFERFDEMKTGHRQYFKSLIMSRNERSLYSVGTINT